MRPPAPTPAPTPARRRAVAALLAAACGVALGGLPARGAAQAQGTSTAPASSAMPAPAVPATPRTVAVLYFDNQTGSPDYDALGRGIAAMLVSDLANLPEIRLVEREKLQAVLDEQQLQRSRAFDPATAVRTGRLLGAEYLLTGQLTAMRPDVRIDTRVVRVETGEIVRTAAVQGREDRFFQLQQRLARELVDALPVAVSPEALERLRAQQERNRVEDARTMVAFSQGLARYDARDYVGAVETLGPLYLRNPEVTVLRLTYEEAKRRSARAAGDAARDKVRAGLRGLLRKP